MRLPTGIRKLVVDPDERAALVRFERREHLGDGPPSEPPDVGV